jgi:hypothetical protein
MKIHDLLFEQEHDELDAVLANVSNHHLAHLAAVLRSELRNVPDFIETLKKHIAVHTITDSELRSEFELAHKMLVRMKATFPKTLRRVSVPSVGPVDGRIVFSISDNSDDDWALGYNHATWAVYQLWGLSSVKNVNKSFVQLNDAIDYIGKLVKDASQ